MVLLTSLATRNSAVGCSKVLFVPGIKGRKVPGIYREIRENGWEIGKFEGCPFTPQRGVKIVQK